MGLKSGVAMAGIMLMTATVFGADLNQLPLGDAGRAYLFGTARAGQLYDCIAGTVVTEKDAVAELAKGRVILLGEEHTSIDQKRLQAKLVAQLAKRVPHLVLGMEFFERGDGPVLEKWTSGALRGEDFLLASHWYDRGSYNWVYYAPVMDTARAHGLRIVGLNIPRAIPHTVSMEGLKGLTKAQHAEIGPVDTSGSPQHRYLISRYFGDTIAMLPPSWFDRMYQAQCVWDVAMARSILAELPDDGAMVVVVGTGHVAYGLGIARRIHEELAARGLPDIRVTTFCPVTAPAPEPAGEEPQGHPMSGMEHGGGAGGTPALFVRSLADVVGVFADRGGVGAVPKIGLKLKLADGKIVVKMAWPDTASAAAGLHPGDQVVDLNGAVPSDIHHLRLALARLRWGDRFDMKVERNGTTIDCAALLEPEVRTVDTTVAPGWKVEPAAPFDPAGVTAAV
ncbi:MAG: PDZ domain-containing protein, partial [Acidobacteria bacterium]|nr:PDZ domain-containing protein [Acidobacteriota bacterium]